MVVFGRNWSEVLLNFKSVLKKPTGAKVTIKPAKCSFKVTIKIEFIIEMEKSNLC